MLFVSSSCEIKKILFWCCKIDRLAWYYFTRCWNRWRIVNASCAFTGCNSCSHVLNRNEENEWKCYCILYTCTTSGRFTLSRWHWLAGCLCNFWLFQCIPELFLFRIQFLSVFVRHTPYLFIIYYVFIHFVFVHICLQCFDTVGWASGRASGL